MLELTSGEHRLIAGQPDAAGAALGAAREILAEVETEIRRVVHDLRPPVLDGLGLPAALRDVAGRFTAWSQVDCRVEIEGRPVRLPPDTEISLYRVVQEALQNVAAHAKAKLCVLRLTFDHAGGSVSVTIADDGCGFDQVTLDRDADHDLPQDGRRHLGLEGMRRRMEGQAGRCTVRSVPGHGTMVRARVPLGDR
jgi:signal transduction histidine kinase